MTSEKTLIKKGFVKSEKEFNCWTHPDKPNTSLTLGVIFNDWTAWDDCPYCGQSTVKGCTRDRLRDALHDFWK